MGAQVVDFDDLRGPRPERNQAEFLGKYVSDRPDETAAGEAMLLCRIVSCILGCSFLFMCGLLPLRVFRMSWGLHFLYYIGFATLCALEWASKLRFKSFGHESPKYVRFCVWVLGTSIHVWTRYARAPAWIGHVYCVCWVFACIFHECPRVLWFLYARNLSMKAGWAFFAGNALGALPCMVTVLIYFTVWQWTSAQPVDMIMLALLWVLLQVCLKWIGVRIWRLAAPAAPFVVPLMWILYVELVLGLLGVGIFMNGAGAALAYSVSIGLTLSIHTVRGIFFRRLTAPDADGHMLQRVVLLFEMLISLVSRLSVFILYVLNCIAEVVFGKPRLHDDQAERLMTSTSYFYPDPFAVFGRSKISVRVGILHGIVCCAISLAITISCWSLLPSVWKVRCTPRAHQVFPDSVGAQACRSVQAEAFHGDDVNSSASSHSSGVRWCRGTARSPDGAAAGAAGAVGPEWLTRGSDHSVRAAQARLLRTFAIEHWDHFAMTYCFTMNLMMLLVTLAQAISFRSFG